MTGFALLDNLKHLHNLHKPVRVSIVTDEGREVEHVVTDIRADEFGVLIVIEEA